VSGEEKGGGAESAAYLREHDLEVGRVLRRAAALGLVLRHARAVDPHELDLLTFGRAQKGLDRLELLAIGVGLSGFHPAMGDGQDLLYVRPADHLLIGDGHLHEGVGMLCTQLLEKGQLLAGESADEVGLEHPEPARGSARRWGGMMCCTCRNAHVRELDVGVHAAALVSASTLIGLMGASVDFHVHGSHWRLTFPHRNGAGGRDGGV
jgi:hypothetical protein